MGRASIGLREKQGGEPGLSHFTDAKLSRKLEKKEFFALQKEYAKWRLL